MNRILILTAVLINNIADFVIMGYDKRQAEKGGWRVSEKSLMLYALFFGAAGIWAGMRVFRHKTKHIKFTVGVPICFVINIAALYFIIRAV